MLIKNKLHGSEAIIRILRQADGGQTVESVCRNPLSPIASFYRWHKKYGDMDLATPNGAKSWKKNAELLCNSIMSHRNSDLFVS